ncbi:MAG: guanylate kinase [Pseudomonadota bacterium]
MRQNDSQPQGLLIVVSAPSGAGKTSLVRAAVERDPRLVVSVSHTTRDQRPGELDGVNYHFVSDAHFRRMIDADDFVEHAEVFGNRYGTSRSALSAAIAAGSDVVLEIDWQGAAQVRTSFQRDQISVFILPPSVSALDSRLRGRGRDDEATIQARMEKARSEMSHFRDFDYLLINDRFEAAVDEFLALVRAERLRLHRQAGQHQHLIDELLG